MHYKRQAHGMVLINDFVYCCAGLDGSYDILNQCEKFNLITRKWTDDVPNMSNKKFSMTMMVQNKI